MTPRRGSPTWESSRLDGPVPLVGAPADPVLPVAAGSVASASLPQARRGVTSTCSRVFDALATVFADLGFGAAVGDRVFRDLVIARVVEPTS